MKTVIVGCGRVGAELAEMFDKQGHEVIVLDVATRAFDRLPGSFRGSAVRGDGTDEDTLRRAGAEDADVFLALTEGDNRNVMAAQVAVEGLGARQVIAKINDPLRAYAYAELGIATLCRTVLDGRRGRVVRRACHERRSRRQGRRSGRTTAVSTTSRRTRDPRGSNTSDGDAVATREA